MECEVVEMKRNAPARIVEVVVSTLLSRDSPNWETLKVMRPADTEIFNRETRPLNYGQ